MGAVAIVCPTMIVLSAAVGVESDNPIADPMRFARPHFFLIERASLGNNVCGCEDALRECSVVARPSRSRDARKVVDGVGV